MSKEISKNHDLCNFIVVQALRKNSLPLLWTVCTSWKTFDEFQVLGIIERRDIKMNDALKIPISKKMDPLPNSIPPRKWERRRRRSEKETLDTRGERINKSVRQKGRRETLPDVILQIGFRFRFRSTERGQAPRAWSSFAESTIFLRFTEPENGRTFTAVNPRRIISSKVKRER